MTKVLLFGATGHLGKAIAREAIRQGYDLTAVVRNKSRADTLSAITSKYIIADIADPLSLQDICNGYEVVISSLGKSVSLNDRSRPSFREIDWLANSRVLEEAIKSGVKKLVYVLALHWERYLHLTYFDVHHQFSEKLKRSGIDFSIIKPPALFSAFLDLVEMAGKGRLINIGSGDKRTNPIYEGDLAKICVDAIKESNVVIEAGGKMVYTRKQLNELIQQKVNPRGKIRNVPMGLFSFMLPVVRVVDRNMYDKLAFFREVMQHDTIAPLRGNMPLEDYLNRAMNGSPVT